MFNWFWVLCCVAHLKCFAVLPSECPQFTIKQLTTFTSHIGLQISRSLLLGPCYLLWKRLSHGSIRCVLESRPNASHSSIYAHTIPFLSPFYLFDFITNLHNSIKVLSTIKSRILLRLWCLVPIFAAGDGSPKFMIAFYGYYRTCGSVWWRSIERPRRLGGEKKQKRKIETSAAKQNGRRRQHSCQAAITSGRK